MFGGFFKVLSGKKYGNEIANYLGVDKRLFHNAMEEGGCEMHLLKLHCLKQENLDLSEVSYHATEYLLPGLLSIENRFGKQEMINNALRNVRSFIEQYQAESRGGESTQDASIESFELSDGRYELSYSVVITQRIRGQEVKSEEPYLMRSDDLEVLKGIALVKSLGGVEVHIKDSHTGKSILIK